MIERQEEKRLFHRGEKPLIVMVNWQFLTRPLSKSEFRALKDSCLDEGIRDPLIVWKEEEGKRYLLDGHNRYFIGRKYDLDWWEEEIALASEEDAKAWMIRNQMARRNISKYDRCKLVQKLEPIYAKMAKERQRDAGKKYGKGHPKKEEGRQVLLEIIKPKDTKLELAKLAGVSKSFYQQVGYIQEYATEKTKEMLERGTMTVNRAAIVTQNEQAKKKAKEEVEERKKKGKQPKGDAWLSARKKASFAVSNLKSACEEFDAIFAEHGSFAFITHKKEITQYRDSVRKSFNKLETLVEKISKDEDEIEIDTAQDEVEIPRDEVKKILKSIK